ncbi:IclR family transcriptional regulator [Yinghuangia sp. YIM S09857]|uniref:IclR family transcriptional regulator n=1 Tax=Yinghuangia sp. YIM S09857 TaxID=3436929 RepID=UPI003F537EEF
MARPSPQTERLVSLVDAIAARPDEGLTLSEIARHLAVAPATCHPMLVSLAELGWLVRHPVRRTYRLGPALIAVGRAAARGLGVVDLARPGMRSLRDELGLTCIALTPGEFHVTVAEVERGPSEHGPHVRVGDQIPIAPPLGVGYVSWADEQTLRRWLDGVTTDPDKRDRHELAVKAARERGYAVELVTRVETELGQALARLDEHLGDRFAAGGGPAEARDPSAARLRTLLEEIAAELGDPDQDPIHEIDPDRDYRVGRIGAGVLEPSGEVALVIALHGFGARTDGRRVADIGRRLAAVAREVSAQLVP